MGGTGSMLHGDPVAPVILGVTTILAFAIIGRIGARKLGQPTVLGELLMGILLGNVAWYLGIDLIAVLREGSRVFDVVNQALLGVPIEQSASDIFGAARGLEIARIVTGPQGGQVMQVAHAVDVFSRYGVIFLLFMVGLRTNLDELRSVGGDAIRVALIGVIAPVALGYGVAALIRPDLEFSTTLFVASTLAATSIGITANVLSETGADKSREGHIILGAAVCDDILALIILAIVSGIVVSGSVHMPDVVRVAFVSALFLVAVIKLGPAIIRLTAKIMRQLDIVEAKMFTSYLFVMVLAWAANLVGLATIIGAFSAGIVLSDRYFRETEGDGSSFVSIRELIMPLEVILVPIFFILMGIQVKIESFLSWPVVLFAAGLLAAAVIGKFLSGLGGSKGTVRMAIGLGMLPRGEVGLVFASIGRTLGVIDDAVFSSIVLMIIVTSLMAPPFLKATIDRDRARRAKAGRP
jgi:Kef-type K+ transport system membrane component KefB